MFKCPQNGTLASAESSQTLMVKNFFCNSHEDLKQLSGLKKTKMVMYSITTKLNSTFGTTGKANTDKMTAKVVGKLKLSLL